MTGLSEQKKIIRISNFTKKKSSLINEELGKTEKIFIKLWKKR